MERMAVYEVVRTLEEGELFKGASSVGTLQ